jgi:hypothetical protein
MADNKSIFDLVEGLKPVDPSALSEFVDAMTKEVIPEIIRVVDERRMLAVEIRSWQLKSA